MSSTVMLLLVLVLIANSVGLAAPKSDGFSLTLRKVKHPLPLMTTTTTTISSKPAGVGTAVKRLFSGAFYTEVSIGTPPLKLNLLVDTGSSPTWVQSAHCSKCFKVSSPNFDQNASLTFQSMASDNPICVPIWLRPSGNSCTYTIDYGAGEDTTNGTFGLDTFTVDGGDGQNISILPGVALGVGLFNILPGFSGDGEGHENPLAGILGLGRDHPSSFLLQCPSITLLRFSYCLPSNDGDQALLRFGTDADLTPGPGGKIQSTPILGSSDDFYNLNMTGTSFNGVLLPIDPGVFMQDGRSYFFIDSGTSFSEFAPKAYTIIRRAVSSYFMDEFSLEPLDVTRSGKDLCYQLYMFRGSSRNVTTTLPTMIWHFDGADLELNEATMFKAFEEVNEYCLMMGPSEGLAGDVNVFGAFQQFNRRFLYDVPASTLSFAPEICSVN